MYGMWRTSDVRYSTQTRTEQKQVSGVVGPPLQRPKRRQGKCTSVVRGLLGCEQDCGQKTEMARSVFRLFFLRKMSVGFGRFILTQNNLKLLKLNTIRLVPRSLSEQNQPNGRHFEGFDVYIRVVNRVRKWPGRFFDLCPKSVRRFRSGFRGFQNRHEGVIGVGDRELKNRPRKKTQSASGFGRFLATEKSTEKWSFSVGENNGFLSAHH